MCKRIQTNWRKSCTPSTQPNFSHHFSTHLIQLTLSHTDQLEKVLYSIDTSYHPIQPYQYTLSHPINLPNHPTLLHHPYRRIGEGAVFYVRGGAPIGLQPQRLLQVIVVVVAVAMTVNSSSSNDITSSSTNRLT